MRFFENDDIDVSEGFERVKYLNEGMTVLAPVRIFARHLLREDPSKERKGICCTVVTAAGYHARIVSERYDIDAWTHIGNLAVKAKT